MALVVASPAPLARSQDDAANRLLDQAAALYEQGSRRESLDKYREALDLLGKSRDRESLLVCCSNASVVAANLGEYEVSYSMASRALGIAVDLGDLEGQAKSLNNLGLAAQFLGRNNEARSRYCGALALNRERRDIESVVTNLGNIGVIEFNSGRLAEALSIYRRALALAREYASEPWAVGQRRIATANLGAVMEKVGESSLALEMYESLLRDPDLPLDQAASLHTSLGRVFLQLEDPGQALSCFEIASNEFESLGDAGGQSNVALHIGATLCQRLKRHGEAQASFGKALEIATRIRDRNEELFDLLFLGKCLLHTGDVALAVSRLHEALSVAQECGSLEGRWSAMFGLGKAAEVSGRPIDALKHHLEGLALVERERESHVPDAFRAGFLADKEESCAAAVRLTLGGGAGPTTPSERMVHAFGIVERFRARSLLDRLEAAPL
ncbi:MAG: tetratricopeptide repeat protein [Planctomycetes bacterium]|nr:tetratricopeptide repeat protein [Planctomycetota bacterium]